MLISEMMNGLMTSYHNNFKTNVERILFPIFVMIIISNFIPLMLGYTHATQSHDNMETNYDMQLKESLPVHMALSSSITCMLPLLLDFLFDYNNIHLQSDADRFMTTSHRNIILILLLIPDVFILFVAIPYQLFDLMYSFANARDIILTIYFLKNLNQYGNQVWNICGCCLIASSSAICNLLLTITFTIHDQNTVDIINYIIQALASLSISIVIFNTIRITNTLLKPKVRDIRSLSKEGIICLSQTYLFLLFYISNWCVSLIPNNLISYQWSSVLGTNFFTMYTCSITLSFTVTYFIGYQLQRKESYQFKVMQCM